MFAGQVRNEEVDIVLEVDAKAEAKVVLSAIDNIGSKRREELCITAGSWIVKSLFCAHNARPHHLYKRPLVVWNLEDTSVITMVGGVTRTILCNEHGHFDVCTLFKSAWDFEEIADSKWAGALGCNFHKSVLAGYGTSLLLLDFWNELTSTVNKTPHGLMVIVSWRLQMRRFKYGQISSIGKS